MQAEPAYSDMLSHYQTFLNLIKVRTEVLTFWNPTNGFGEISLLNYFPLPFFIMKIASLFFLPNVAFNLVAFLSLPLLLGSIFYCLKKSNVEFAKGVLLSLFAALVLYSPYKDHWGGTALGVFLGQFSHVYALSFLFLFRGALVEFFTSNRSVGLCILFASGAILSHSIVALWLPLMGCDFLFTRKILFQRRFMAFFKIGLGAFVLTSFYWVPFLDNLTWTFYVKSRSKLAQFWDESNIPQPILILGVLALVFTCAVFYFKGSRQIRRAFLFSRSYFFIFIGSLIYLAFFHLMKITPGRALHQIHYFFILWLGLYIITLVEQLQKKSITVFFYIALTVFITKYLFEYKDIQFNEFKRQFAPKLEDFEDNKKSLALLRNVGNLSQPRIDGPFYLGGNNRSIDFLGDWFLLPRYTGRLVPGTLYIENNHTNAYWLYFRGLLGFSPCYPESMLCSNGSLSTPLSQYMNFLGISDLIFRTEPHLDALAAKLAMTKRDLGQFSVLSFSNNVSLVDVIGSEQIKIEWFSKNYRNRFKDSFIDDVKYSRYLVLKRDEDIRLSVGSLRSKPDRACKPKLEVDFNSLKLYTDCPGYLHRIKFAYNSALVSDEPLHLISPGFIGVIPSKNILSIQYKRKFLWRVFDAVSLFFLIAILAFEGFRRVYYSRIEKDSS